MRRCKFWKRVVANKKAAAVRYTILSRLLWVRAICHNREDMVGTIFFASEADDEPAFLFLYAKRSPYEVRFLGLRRCDAVLPAYARLAPHQRLELEVSHPRRRFEVLNTHTTFEGWPFGADEPVYVVEGARLDGSGYLFADSPRLALYEWLSYFPTPEKGEATSTAARGRKVAEPDLVKHPWLADYIQKGARKAKRGDRLPTVADQPDSDRGSDSGSEVEGAWEELEKGLLEASASFHPGFIGDAFFMRYRPGPRGSSSSSTEGRGDVLGAEASKGLPRAWCRQYALTQTTSFSAGVYGENVATAMCLEWCSRMAHFFAIWCDSGDPKYVFSTDDVRSHVAGEDWVALRSTFAANSASKERADLIDALVPAAPLE